MVFSMAGEKLIAGVDEAGRGPLAGPVVAAAVIIAPGNFPDSKSIPARQREILYAEILSRAVAVGVSAVPPSVIDRINIRRAALLAMREAVLALFPKPDLVLVDGRDEIPNLGIPQRAITHGDKLEPLIGAASIVAKVARDMLMSAYSHFFPKHNFAGHKGYPTKQHYSSIARYGITILHRRSFRLG